MEYDELYTLNNTGTVTLVKDKTTGELFVRKLLKVYDLSIYDFLTKTKPPGIPLVRSFDETPDGLLVVEEYVNGRTLANIIEDEGPPDFDVAIDYLIRLCQILEPLHSNTPPIVHRDIKPSNILITNQDEVYLLDFNAATRFNDDKDRDTVLIGTTGYAAPEQYGFKASDPSADVYALGRTAQELFTGEKSFPESYDGPLSEIIKKCLELSPSDRFHDASDLLRAIRKQTRKPRFLRSSLGSVSSQPAIKKVHAASWLPPGYRTRTPWKMLLATLYYLLWIFAIISSAERRGASNTPVDIFGDVVVVLYIILETFFFLDYKGIKSKLPLTRSPELLSRVIGHVLYFFLIYAFTVLLYNFVKLSVTIG